MKLREYLEKNGFTEEHAQTYRDAKRGDYQEGYSKKTPEQLESIRLYAKLRMRYIRKYQPDKYREARNKAKVREKAFKKKRMKRYLEKLAEKYANQGIAEVKKERDEFLVERGYNEQCQATRLNMFKKYALKRGGAPFEEITQAEKDADNVYRRASYLYQEYVIKGLI